MSSSESEGGGYFITVTQLKQRSKKSLQNDLKKYNLPHSGKNKEVLAKRLYRHLIQMDSSDSSDNTSDSEDDEPQEVSIPSPDCLEDWLEAETEHVPSLEDKDVNAFYAFHRHPQTGALLNFKNMRQKAKKLANEKYVRKVEYHAISENSSYCYFRCTCQASMKSKSYKVNVCIFKDIDSVQSAYCTCPAGKSHVCCHTGALLFHLVKIRNACTSHGCTWLEPDNNYSETLKRFSDIVITNTAEKTATPSVKPYPGVYKAGPCVDPDQFYKDCIAGLADVNPDCVLYKVMCETVDDIEPFTKIYSPTFCYVDSIELSAERDSLTEYVDRLYISSDVCEMIEKATRGQASNRYWKQARSFLITASKFGSVVKRKSDTPPDNLVKVLQGYVPYRDTRAMSYGRHMKSKTLKRYAQHHMTQCKGFVSTET